MPTYEKGICVFCGKCRDDCLVSNLGSVCHDCWQRLARESRPGRGSMVAIPPGPDLYGYVVVEKERTYITVDRTLLIFAQEDHAQERADLIRREDPGSDPRVERVQALEPFLYCMNNGLKCLFVEGVEDSR